MRSEPEGSHVESAAIVIAPNGSTAYVTNADDATVTPIDTATNTPSPENQAAGPSSRRARPGDSSRRRGRDRGSRSSLRPRPIGIGAGPTSLGS
jgi:hypothetical protein